MTLTARHVRSGSGGSRGAGGLLTIANVFAGMGNYIYSLALTHAMPTAQYTVFAGITSLLLIIGTISTAGVPWVLARDLALNDGDLAATRRSVTFSFWLNVWVGLVLAAVVAVVAAGFAGAGVVAAASAAAFLLTLGSTGMGWLQGLDRTGWLASLMTLEVVAKVVAGVALTVALQGNAIGAVIGAVIGSFALFCSFAQFWRLIGPPRIHVDTSDLWVSAGRIGGLRIGVAVIGAADTLLAAMLHFPSQSAAAYQAASTLGRAPLFVSTALSIASFPRLVRSDPGVRGSTVVSYLVLSGTGAVILVTMPETLLGVVFSAEFTGVAHWLHYAAPLGVAVGLLNLLTTFIQAHPRSWLPHGVLAAAGAGYVVLASVAGSRFGMDAFAVTTVVLATGLVIATLLLPDLSGVAAEVFTRPNLLMLVAIGLGGAVLWAVPWLWLWLLVAVALGLVATLVAFPEFRPARPARTSGRGSQARPARHRA